MVDLDRLLQDMTLSRRSFAKRAAAVALAGPVVGSLLAACGGDDDDDDEEPTATSESGGGEATADDSGGAATETMGSDEPTEADSGSGDMGEPVAGGKVSMSLADNDAQNFDPIIPTDNMSIWTMLLIYDQVIRIGPDGLSLEPGLAESWEVSDDGMIYTFHLREAQFHDGTPVTSEDVAYCVNRVVTDEESQWNWIFTAIDTVDAPDESTVVINLSQVWVPFLADMALYSASIYPMALHEEMGAALFDSPVGTGPFKFEVWEKDNRIVLVKNESFWTEGEPYLDELEFFVLPDANTRMLKFQAGELDIATDVPFSQMEALDADPNVQVLTEGAARADFVYMNTTIEPFNDVNVRLALNYGVDKEAIIDSVLFGYGQPANTMLPLMLYHADNLEGFPYDPDKANELLAESAYPDGFEFEVIVGTGDVVGQQALQIMQANYADLNITLNIRQAEPGSATDEIRALEYETSKGYYTTDIIDPDELIVFGFSPLGGIDAMRTGWSNEELDQLIVDAQAETDPATREEMYAEIQAIHNSEIPVILLYYPSGRTALASDIHGFHILPTGNYRMWEVWRA